MPDAVEQLRACRWANGCICDANLRPVGPAGRYFHLGYKLAVRLDSIGQ